MQRNKTPLSLCEQTPGGSLGRGAGQGGQWERSFTFSRSGIPSPVSLHDPCPKAPVQSVPRHPAATSQPSHPHRALGLPDRRTPSPPLPPLRCLQTQPRSHRLTRSGHPQPRD